MYTNLIGSDPLCFPWRTGFDVCCAAMRRYVRNTTARAFSVVASALGIPALLPFLKAVCQSKKSWQARHTGIKIVQQIAILMGCAVLPHLKVCQLLLASSPCICFQAVSTLPGCPFGIWAFLSSVSQSVDFISNLCNDNPLLINVLPLFLHNCLERF